MKRISRTLSCAALIALAAACGGKQSMASKSAAAYARAQEKGIPVTAGDHAGHAHHDEAAPMSGMDHSAMHEGHAEMDHAHMDHSAMDHSAMDHGATDHGAMSHAAMQHGAMPGMQHAGHAMEPGEMPAMEHGSAHGMQHGTTARVTMVTESPASNSAMARVNPSATLRSDEFDAPPKKDRE